MLFYIYVYCLSLNLYIDVYWNISIQCGVLNENWLICKKVLGVMVHNTGKHFRIW